MYVLVVNHNIVDLSFPQKNQSLPFESKDENENFWTPRRGRSNKITSVRSQCQLRVGLGLLVGLLVCSQRQLRVGLGLLVGWLVGWSVCL